MESQLSKGLVMDTEWKEDLEGWLEPFLIALGNKTRRRMCSAYIAGLIGPADRKRVQPMASRASEIGYDQLHHFVAAGAWGRAPIAKLLVQEADRLVGDAEGFRSEERREGKEGVRNGKSRW